jgi:zinc-ribbon domain
LTPNFCPNCGQPLGPDQSFCRKCGYNLQQRMASSQPPTTSLANPVYGMHIENLYMIADQGLVRVGTQFSLTVLPFVIGAVLALVAVIVLDFGSWDSLAVAIILVLLPIFGTYRARRLLKLVSLSRETLLAKKGVQQIPWSAVQHMIIKGKTLTFKLAHNWTSVTIDKNDVERLSAKASATLGAAFASIPEVPRLSPARKLLLLTLGLFAMTQALTMGASLAPFFPGEQDRYLSLYTTVRQSVGTASIFQQWAAIYFNNVQIALASFVPGFGFLTLGLSSYNTGRVIQAAAIYFNLTPTTFLVNLYLFPHSWVEELSYPLAGALGLYALTWRKQSFAEFSNWKTRASTKVSLAFAAVAIVLAIAALLEVTEPHLGLAGLLLWAPVLVAGVYLYVRFKSKLIAAVS